MFLSQSEMDSDRHVRGAPAERYASVPGPFNKDFPGAPAHPGTLSQTGPICAAGEKERLAHVCVSLPPGTEAQVWERSGLLAGYCLQECGCYLGDAQVCNAVA